MERANASRSARAQEERSLREDRGASEDSDCEDEECACEEEAECDVRPRAAPPRRLKAFVALERLCGRVFAQPWTFVRETLELFLALVVLAVLAHSFYVAHEDAILNLFAPAVRLSQHIDELVQQRAANATRRFPRFDKHKAIEGMQRPR